MNILGIHHAMSFATNHPHARSAVFAWLARVRNAAWKKFADVRHDYNSADLVGRDVVFNIGGNKFRLIAQIDYANATVYIRHVLTHKDYDRGKWKS